MTMHIHLDSSLRCARCGDQFIFSAGERELRQLRGIDKVPAQCPSCSRGALFFTRR